MAAPVANLNAAIEDLAMKPIKSLFILAAVMLVPTIASAQGYYGGRGGGGGYYANPAPSSQLPGGFHNRQGRLIWGFSLGLGGMHDTGGSIECTNCTYSTASGQVSGHIGGFIGPRLALLGEAQANLQTLSTDIYGDTTLIQSALMVAAQYWVTPQLWIKGGIGFANVAVDSSYYGTSDTVDTGMALMGAVGYELLSSRFFSIDLQGRLINGEYKGIDDTSPRRRSASASTGSSVASARGRRTPGTSPAFVVSDGRPRGRRSGERQRARIEAAAAGRIGRHGDLRRARVDREQERDQIVELARRPAARR